MDESAMHQFFVSSPTHHLPTSFLPNHNTIPVSTNASLPSLPSSSSSIGVSNSLGLTVNGSAGDDLATVMAASRKRQLHQQTGSRVLGLDGVGKSDLSTRLPSTSTSYDTPSPSLCYFEAGESPQSVFESQNQMVDSCLKDVMNPDLDLDLAMPIREDVLHNIANSLPSTNAKDYLLSLFQPDSQWNNAPPQNVEQDQQSMQNVQATNPILTASNSITASESPVLEPLTPPTTPMVMVAAGRSGLEPQQSSQPVEITLQQQLQQQPQQQHQQLANSEHAVVPTSCNAEVDAAALLSPGILSAQMQHGFFMPSPVLSNRDKDLDVVSSSSSVAPVDNSLEPKNQQEQSLPLFPSSEAPPKASRGRKQGVKRRVSDITPTTSVVLNPSPLNSDAFADAEGETAELSDKVPRRKNGKKQKEGHVIEDSGAGSGSGSASEFGEVIEGGQSEAPVEVHPCMVPGCGKVFPKMFNLKSHMKVHCAERPFQCALCTIKFARNHDLLRHVRTIHSASRPQRCNSCNKSDMTLDELKRHRDECPHSMIGRI
ncbi:Metallothionein expression activator [Blyttiomyces sp. JEL0837]|nr:Metallothionein expression activator [Blyttiomyces sp. JEL0837]